MKARSVVLGLALTAMAHAGAIADERSAPPSQAVGEVKFRFDSAALPSSAPGMLGSVVRLARAHPEQRIVLDAHCDPVGTSPYNVGLAIRRATSVREQLTASGVPGEQIVFAIYGKDGVHRARHADDRRVTLWLTRRPLAAVAERTFAGRGTAVTWGRPLTTAQIQSPPEPVASAVATRGRGR